jgi:hypothetical protein
MGGDRGGEGYRYKPKRCEIAEDQGAYPSVRNIESASPMSPPRCGGFRNCLRPNQIHINLIGTAPRLLPIHMVSCCCHGLYGTRLLVSSRSLRASASGGRKRGVRPQPLARRPFGGRCGCRSSGLMNTHPVSGRSGPCPNSAPLHRLAFPWAPSWAVPLFPLRSSGDVLNGSRRP